MAHRRRKGGFKHPKRGDTKTPSGPQSGFSMRGAIQNSVALVDRHQRLSSVGHVVTSVFIGLAVGTLLAIWVIYVTGNFSTPWTYMLNLGSVLLLKVILQWIWTTRVNPFAEKQAKIFVSNRTGQELQDSIENVSQGGGQQVQSLVTTVIAAVGVATVLVTTEDLKPAWLLESIGIITASALSATLTLMAEALSTQTTIYALWKNRHQYQETPSYQGSGRRAGS